MMNQERRQGSVVIWQIGGGKEGRRGGSISLCACRNPHGGKLGISKITKGNKYMVTAEFNI